MSSKLLFIYIVVGLILIAKVFLAFELKQPSTSDAQLDGEVILIVSQVSGQISNIYVKNNQYVRKGDILFSLDAKEYELQAQISKNALELEKMNFEEKLKTQSAEYERLKNLLDKENPNKSSHSKSKEKNLETAYLKAKSNYLKVKTVLDSKLKMLQDKLEETLLQLSKTEIRAPISGYITNLRLYAGSHVRAYEDLFGLVNKENLWITANYLEYELINIKEGDIAKLNLSMYPNVTLYGKVDSIGYGIRPENYQNNKPFPNVSPTINWIRLAKRFPVKILINHLSTNEVLPLRVGANVFVTVYTGKSEKRQK